MTTGRRPQLPDQAVCLECKRRGIECVVVTRGEPCLGPVTQTGCGAICPGMGRGCYGCFGPREGANVDSLAGWFVDGPGAGGMKAEDVGRLFAGFTGASPSFRTITDRLGGRTPLPLLPATARPPEMAAAATAELGHRNASPGRMAMHAGDVRFQVKNLTRVEGEGSLHLLVQDGQVAEARLQIFEAPRYFEALVVGRAPDEVLDIVSRICGICPVAYQMSAVHAFEDLFGVEVEPATRCAPPTPVLRGMDREPRAPHLPAARARLPGLPERGRAGQGSPAARRRRAATEADRQPPPRPARRPRHPSRQRPCRRLVQSASAEAT